MKKKFIILTTIPETFHFFKGQINFLNNVFDVELVSSPGDKLNMVGAAENVVVHPIKMERDISFLKDFISLIKLILLFKKLKPEIVHGNTPKGALLSMLASWFARVPVRIYYIHGLRFEGDTGIKRNILLFMERFTCLLATDIFTVSFGVKENILKNKMTKKEVQVVGNGSINGIDANFYCRENVMEGDLLATYKIPNNTLIFGFVGRLVGDKGINELVSVFKEINKKYTNTKLLLVGWTEDKLDPLQEITKQEIKTNENILAVGAQSDVRPFLKIMNVFVFPSYREGFGVSIMEAAAMNLPVISSDISGCNEIIEDGFNGILVPPKSIESLFNAMELFIKQPEKIMQMSQVTRDRIIKKYNQDYIWKEALVKYQDLLN